MPSYLVLARKYRPTTFGDVVGQDHVVQTLKNSILSGRVAHAFLFCGVRGVGKTTVARILAKALNCSQKGEKDAEPCNECLSCKEITRGISVDVQEIDGASNTSVENIREINENIKYPPVSSPYKIIIIDEVHMISINAFNALLKTLEEPPSHAKFIFATTESHKVPATINSRCQRFNFRTISLQDIVKGMAGILEKEGLTASEEALALVAREARGSFRDALSLLDQVIAFGAHDITDRDVVGILGISGREAFSRVLDSVLSKNAAEALRTVHEVFQQGYDPEQFVLDLIQYLRNLIIVKSVPAAARQEGMVDAPQSEIQEMERLGSRTSIEHLHNLFAALLKSESEVKRAGNPWVALEMTLFRMCYSADLVSLSEIVRRIDSDFPKEAVRLPSGPERKPRPKETAVRELPEPHKIEPPSSPPPTPRDRQNHETPPERFTITRVTPVPAGTPDEVWGNLKTSMTQAGIDPIVISLMEHGTLISFGPTEVEIGFHSSFYKGQFESRLKDKPELRKLLDEFFGDARIKILTLAQRTSLDTEKPYGVPSDDQTDLERALKNEALEHPLVRAVLGEFEGSSVEEIKIISSR